MVAVNRTNGWKKRGILAACLEEQCEGLVVVRDMADPKNPKVRLQWQDGVGNMLILVEDENQDKKTVR